MLMHYCGCRSSTCVGKFVSPPEQNDSMVRAEMFVVVILEAREVVCGGSRWMDVLERRFVSNRLSAGFVFSLLCYVYILGERFHHRVSFAKTGTSVQ